MKRLLLAVYSFTILVLGTGVFYSQNSVNENVFQRNEDIIAYPNPTKDILFLKTAQHNIRVKSIVFFDILGTQVAHFSANSNSVEIDISRLKQGKYLMKYVLSDNTQKVKQIIKQ